MARLEARGVAKAEYCSVNRPEFTQYQSVVSLVGSYVEPPSSNKASQRTDRYLSKLHEDSTNWLIAFLAGSLT